MATLLGRLAQVVLEDIVFNYRLGALPVLRDFVLRLVRPCTADY
jgi:hypothetical protein